MGDNRAVVSKAGEGGTIALGPAQNVVKVDSAASGGRVGVLEMTLAAFDRPPQHRHDEVDHVWYVLEGRVRAVLGTEDVTLDAGTTVFVPHGVPHTFWNLGPEPCRMLEFDTPRTLEGYYEELSTAFPPGSTLDPNVAREIQARHDTFV